MFDNHREYNLKLGENPSKIDEAMSTLYFIGYALNLGENTTIPKWKIKKIEKIGSVWEIQYANGNELYENVWDNRASLNYK